MVKLIDRIMESRFSNRLAKWIEDTGQVLYALRPRYPEHGTNSRGASGVYHPSNGRSEFGGILSNGRSEFGVMLRFEEYERKQIIEEDYSI